MKIVARTNRAIRKEPEAPPVVKPAPTVRKSEKPTVRKVTSELPKKRSLLQEVLEEQIENKE